MTGEGANEGRLDAARSRELTAIRGVVGNPVTKVISADAVRRFLGATARAEDGPPASIADVKAGDAVPFTFFCPDPIVAADSMGLPRARPLDRNIDGGSEWELRRVVRVGDVLTLVPRVADVQERLTSDGRRMVTTVVEIFAWDEEGAVVGTARGRYLSYEGR